MLRERRHTHTHTYYFRRPQMFASGDLAIDAVIHRRRRDWIAKPDTYNNVTRQWYLYRHSSCGVVQWCSQENRKHTRRGGGCWKRCQSQHENTREDRASESQGKRFKGAGDGIYTMDFLMGIERLQTRPYYYRWNNNSNNTHITYNILLSSRAGRRRRRDPSRFAPVL